MQLAIGSALTTFGAATLLRGADRAASAGFGKDFWIPPFLRRFLRGISCSGALLVTYAFFPRKSHPRSLCIIHNLNLKYVQCDPLGLGRANTSHYVLTKIIAHVLTKK